MGIHAEQIDQSNNLLTIDRQFDQAENKIVQRTKGKKIRRVYLIDEVMKALSPLLQNTEQLFRKEDNSTLPPDYFRKFILPKACIKSGLKVISPHVTRHTFASIYLMNGGSLWDLSKILGHSSTTLTEERYAHFDLEHVKIECR